MSQQYALPQQPQQYALPQQPQYAIPQPYNYYPVYDETPPEKVKKDHGMIIAILIIVGIAILAFLIGFILIWYRWFNYPVQ